MIRVEIWGNARVSLRKRELPVAQLDKEEVSSNRHQPLENLSFLLVFLHQLLSNYNRFPSILMLIRHKQFNQLYRVV